MNEAKAAAAKQSARLSVAVIFEQIHNQQTSGSSDVVVFVAHEKPFFVLFRIKMIKPKEAENLKRVRVLNLHTNNHCGRQ